MTALALLSARLVGGLAQTVSFLLLARFVSPSEFGAIASLVGVATFGVAIADLGVGTLLIRERASNKESPLIRPILRVNALGMTALAIVLCVLFAVFFSGQLTATVGLLLIGWTLLERNSETWLALAIADARNRLTIALIILRRVLPLGVMGIFLLLTEGEGADIWFAAGQAVGGLVGVVLARTALGRTLPAVSSRVVGSGVLSRALPYWIAVGSAQVRELEVGTVQLVSSVQSAADFAIASRILKPAQLIASSVAQATLAKLSRPGVDNRTVRRSALALLILAGSGSAVGVAIGALAPAIVQLTVGEGYDDAVSVLQVGLVGVSAAALSSPMASLLQARGAARTVATTSVIFAVLGLVSAVTGTLLAGPTGAMTGVSVAYALKFLVLATCAFRLRV